MQQPDDNGGDAIRHYIVSYDESDHQLQHVFTEGQLQNVHLDKIRYRWRSVLILYNLMVTLLLLCHCIFPDASSLLENFLAVVVCFAKS